MPELPDDRPIDLLLVGHVNVDRFLRVRRFPAADRTVPVLANRAELGGTAANIARVAAGFGVRTGLVARLGPDFPPEFLETLRRAGIDLAGVETVPGRPTPTCYTVEDRTGGQRTMIDQGPMGDDVGPYVRVPPLANCAWVHLTTGPPSAHLDLAARARAAGARVAVDPAQEVHYRWNRRTFRRLLDGAEILFGNRAEIVQAVRLLGVGSPNGLLAHVPLVVRTEGSRGATAFARTGSVHVDARPARRRRTIVGAGDAFRGGFYAGWFAGQPLEGCLEAGARAASHWVEGAR